MAAPRAGMEPGAALGVGARRLCNMARAEPFAAVLGALRGCYAETTPLEAFVRRLQEGGTGEVEVLRGDDAQCYRTFVSQCVVCVPRGARAIPRPICFQQLSSQSEVITRIIQRLCEKKKKNILAYGYSLLDENSCHFRILPSSCIYSYLPNTVTETIRISGLWEMLLSRIGDDVMMYLLEHCALFMLVPPSNCYQVCGQPVYELISHNIGPSPGFVRRRYSRFKHNCLLDYVRKRLVFHRHYLTKSHWWKCRPRRQGRVSSRRKRRSHRLQSLRSGYQSSAKVNFQAGRWITTVTARLEKQSHSGVCLPARAPSLKRKHDGEQDEIVAKRVKVMEKETEEQACNIIPDVNQSSSQRHGTWRVAPRAVGLIKESYISQRHNGEVSRPSVVHRSHPVRRPVADKSSFPRGVQGNKRIKTGVEKQAESNRKGIEMYINPIHKPNRKGIEKLVNLAHKPGLDSVQTEPMESASSEDRKQENPPAHLAKQLPNTFLRSAVYFEKKFLLYSRSYQEYFPKSFILSRLQGCQAGGRRLIETIFLSQNPLKEKQNQSLPQQKWRKKRLPKRYWQMREIFQKLVKNHEKCPYLVFLRKNCPVLLSEACLRKTELTLQAALPGEAKVHKHTERGKESTEGTASNSFHTPPSMPACGQPERGEQHPAEGSDPLLRELLRQHSSHWQVYGFVRECLERVIPAELWGSSHNKCRFFKNVKAFISMGKYDKLSLQQLMWKMRVNDCVWLRLAKGNHSVPAYEHCYREEILAKFLYWLMDSYVIELLKSFFYITETMFQKNMLFYYRKFIWGKLQNIGIRNHFAKVHLRALSSEEMEVIRQKKYFPIASRLRFIPKINGLRPVVKLSRVVEGQKLSKESREKKIQRYNTQLKNLFSVLNYERTVNTSIIGSSVFGRDDIYRKWKEFVTKVFESGGEMPHFYFVKGDVSRAFDTIPHKKLVEVISQVLKPESQTVYGIRWYAVIMITPTGKARKLYKRHVSTFEDFIPDMKQFVSKLQERTSLRNAIVVEQCLTFNENSSTLFTFFLQMLHNNILEIGRRYYVQCSGIPQGSILSTLLCSLCYGDMENKLLCGIQKDGVLIRLIDDFLLVTPHLMQARTFLRTIAAGIPEYGFLINAKKTVVNFPVDDIPGCSKFKQLPDCRLISWCGLLLDVQTLEVYCDYSSYAFTSIRSSLSFNSSRIAGRNMKCKLTAVLKLKCHPLLLDLKINSLKTVLINIYKIFLLQAYRFHACVLQLPFNQKVRNNPYFFLRIISDTASCCYFILKFKNPGVSLGSKDASGMFPFEAAEWLCYHAFIVKLSSHKVIYKCLLKPLKVYKMHLFGKISKDTMELLKTVTEPSLCQDFKTILD
ncbi:telomerase reverse transcriptase isoform X2 [Numida meleagris]|uniref:telomerase reverse transcriptase isoform X2 n=1 Tax=Numida meleagris TaxID=8996 RepID=UPI000B3DB2F9|nr:telomerase reverse transcriptase isoform X2 [Numida meleagris]